MNYFIRILLPLTILFGLIACNDIDKTIDYDLQFAINTAYNSKGLSYYQLPQSHQLNQIPQDPANRLTPEKVALGRFLFHEPGFGTKSEFADMVQTFSCASCHHADAGFQANLPQGIGDGGIGFGHSGEGRQIDLFVAKSKVDVQSLRTPSAMNIAYQTNLLWNGQFGATALNEGTNHLWPEEGPVSVNHLGFEGPETQAIAGLEVHRHEVDATSVAELGYKQLFDDAFPGMPEEERYSNITAGLAIAAYERTILAYKAPFQQWLRGNNDAMSDRQKQGGILFFTKAGCNDCHNGPNLASMKFEAIGLNDFEPALVANFDPKDPGLKGRGGFTQDAADDYKFKIPQLYNLADSPFYGHGATFTSIRDLIAYKNQGIPENTKVPKKQLSEYFQPLKLSEEEIDLLTDFVENALYDPNLSRYIPEALPSNMCFPNNDWMSRVELGCE